MFLQDIMNGKIDEENSILVGFRYGIYGMEHG